MIVNIQSSKLIACMCEGGAETVIMDILIDNDMLIFKREQLIEETVIPRISVKEFEHRYLRREYDEKMIILRVIDSRREKFNLGEAYRCQVEMIDIITTPEIEMLIIVSQGKYGDYKKSKFKKPSEYCKSILKIKNVKSPSFVSDYFSNPQLLVNSIKEYHRLHKQEPNEASLYDFLKEEYKQ